MKYCKVCSKEIPFKRVQLGYTDTCVEHSDVFKYTSVTTASGKTDYSICILRDLETAKHMQQLLMTRGVL